MPRKPSAKSPRTAPFAFGEVSVAAGTVHETELDVARLPPGTWSKMPVVVVHGARPGPTLWLSGAVHGDELIGVDIVRRLLNAVRPKRLAGTLIAVPIVNVLGAISGSRYLPDRRDLNRSFPGSPRGSLAARLAHIFFDSVVARCDYGLDFHTGSGGRCNLPQVRCDLDDPEARRLALAFGAPLLLHSTLRDGSLRAAARTRGVHVLLYEAGEALRFDERAIQLGVDGALRMLAALKMISAAPSDGVEPPILARSSKWMRAGRSGFCHPTVELGQRVVAGETLATITDSIGSKEVPVRSRVAGIVIGIQRTAIVHRGDAVVHVAEPTG